MYQPAQPNILPYDPTRYYNAGEKVTNLGKTWRCKPFPYTGLCNWYEPGVLYSGNPLYLDAWEEVLITASPTVSSSPSASPSKSPSQGQPPQPAILPFDTTRTYYEAGELVTNQGKIWRCKSWPWTGRCSQDGYAPGVEYNGEPLYLEAWEEALVPTASPSYKPSSSPSAAPSNAPSGSPSTNPSSSPSEKPSLSPSAAPSYKPSSSPSESPSDVPIEK